MSKKIDLKFVNDSAPYLSDENLNYMVGIVNDNAVELDNNTKSINTRIDQVSEDIRDIEHGIIPPAVIEEQVENYVQSHQATLATKSEVKSLKNGEHGGYNLIPFPYYRKKSTVNRGITYTVNGDGSITANGTVTETTLDSFFDCGTNNTNYIDLPIGTYKIISGANGEADNKYWAMVFSDAEEIARSTRSNNVFSITRPTRVYVQCRVYRNTTVSNLTFHPMLVEVSSDGSYPTEYERWIPSVQNIEDNKAENTTISDIFDIEKSYSVGDYFISDNVLYKVKVACSGVQPPNTTYYEASNVISALNQGLTNIMDSVTAIAKSVKTVTSASNVLNINKLQLVIGYQKDGTTFAFINKGGNHTISGYFSNANQLGDIYVNTIGSHNISNVAFSIVYTLE